MDERSKDKIACTTPFGLFEFEVMTLDCTVPQQHSRELKHALQNCCSFPGHTLIIIVVFSDAWEKHPNHLHKVMDCSCKANLYHKDVEVSVWKECST